MSLILGKFPLLHITWSGNLAVSDCAGLDQRAVQVINGDDGGTWAPSTTIEISGNVFGLYIVGPTLIWGAGAQLVSTASGSSFFTCNVGDFPLFSSTHSGRTRVLRTGFASAVASPWHAVVPGKTGGGKFSGGAQTISPSFSIESGGVTQRSLGDFSTVNTAMFLDLLVHNGATLSSVLVSFKVAQPHSSLPTQLPMARVLRVDTGGVITPMSSTAMGADVNGYVTFPAPTTGTAYYSGGVAQSWSIHCDSHNIVDIAQYTYVLEVLEEQNGTVVQFLAPVSGASTGANINPVGFGGSIDGNTIAQNTRYLLKDQTAAEQNGVWVSANTSLAAWTRPADWANGSIVPQWTEIYVQQGGVNAGQYFQLSNQGGVLVGGPPSWTVNTVYSVGQTVIPTPPNSYQYRVLSTTGTGTSDPSTQPAFPTTVGATVIDHPGGNQIVWVAEVDTSGSANITGSLQRQGNIWIDATATLTNIPGEAFQ